MVYNTYFTSNVDFFITELKGKNQFQIDAEGNVTGFSINGQVTVLKSED
jgi:hypothetical protein